METRLLTFPSASFELRLSQDGQWYVIAAHNTKSGTAHAMVGRGFKPGDNPYLWAQGYAMRLQTEINKEEP